MATAHLNISSKVLHRIVSVVSRATAHRPMVATHFTETVVVEPTTEGVRFTCADGYRLHQVETFKGMADFDGEQAVFGVGWLQQILKEVASSDCTLDLFADARPDPKIMVEAWDVWVDVDQHGWDNRPQHFDIGGKWPNREALIDYDTIEFSTGFHPIYLNDMFKAALAWWDKDTKEAALPLVIKQMDPQKMSTFTIRNAIGRLSMTVMPKIFQDDEE